MYLSCDCGWGSASDSAGELTAFLQNLSCIYGIRFVAEKKREEWTLLDGKERRRMKRQGKGWRGKGGGRLRPC